MSRTFGTIIKSKRLILAITLFLLVAVGYLAGMFERADQSLYDAYFRFRGVVNPGNEVVIVGIDDLSTSKLGSFPWQRSTHARLLNKLRLSKAVGFDLVFDLPDQTKEDELFAEAIAKNGKVVLASLFSFEKKAGELNQVFIGPNLKVGRAATGIGFANIPTDSDGVVRRLSTVDVNNFTYPLPSFALALYLATEDKGMDTIRIEPGLLKIADKKVPIDEINQAMPNFWGPQETFTTYSYYDVLNTLSPETFKDKIVLVGPTASLFHDEHPTPFTTSNMVQSGNLPTPGVEVQASIVQTLIDGIWYRKASSLVNLLLLLLMGLTTTFVVSNRGPWTGLAGVILILLALLSVTYTTWLYAHLWIQAATPLALVLLTYVVMTSVDFISAEIGRRRTRAMLRRYVSPAVAEELMDSSQSVSLGGHRQTVTIMFCDIRGFTAYSENKEPEEVVKRLNAYLTEMTSIIFKNGGMLDKYLGDGLMAVFGAPIYFPDHVARAVKAAISIKAEIKKLNELWVERGEQPLQVGIGINSGSVLLGNVGSPDRMDYTVIGEDVNLASRVEGLTKIYKTPIVVTDRSVGMLGNSETNVFDFEFMGEVEIRGFTLPIGVYTLN